MGVFDFFGSIFKANQTAKLIEKPKDLEHGANWVAPSGVEYSYPPIKAMAAYGSHSWTYAAVSRASSDIASLKLYIQKGKGKDAKRIDNHPFLDLLEFPNPEMDQTLFIETLCTDLMLSGNFYILKIGDPNPVALVRLHPQNVQIETDETGVTAYLYDVGHGQKVRYSVDVVYHGRGPSYETGPNSQYGQSPIMVLARDIDSDINATTLASKQSATGRPDILLSPKDPADIWGRERRKELERAFTNLNQTGNCMVLSGEVDVQTLNLSARDTEYANARALSRQSVSACYGVPPTVLGLPSANFSQTV